MQGSMSVADYCRKQKELADALTAVGTPIVDRSLVLNTLRGLSPHFAHMRTLISMQRPMPTFLETRSALLLEELTDIRLYIRRRPGHCCVLRFLLALILSETFHKNRIMYSHKRILLILKLQMSHYCGLP